MPGGLLGLKAIRDSKYNKYNLFKSIQKGIDFLIIS